MDHNNMASWLLLRHWNTILSSYHDDFTRAHTDIQGNGLKLESKNSILLGDTYLGIALA